MNDLRVTTPQTDAAVFLSLKYPWHPLSPLGGRRSLGAMPGTSDQHFHREVDSLLCDEGSPTAWLSTLPAGHRLPESVSHPTFCLSLG